MVESLLKELDQVETDADTHQADLQSARFTVESRLQPVNVIFLYRVIELTGEITGMGSGLAVVLNSYSPITTHNKLSVIS